MISPYAETKQNLIMKGDIMRKNFKSLSAILMTSVLAVSAGSMAMPAFADDTYSITMSSTTGHTYTAYQIFTGDLHEDTNTAPTTKTLSNVNWGTGVDKTALITALTGDTTYGAAFSTALTGKTTDKEKAEAVAKQLATYTSASDAKALAKIIGAHLGTASSGLTGLNAGYYLIKDTTAQALMPDGETYSDFMLEVVSDVTVAAKDATVESAKTVTETDDTTPTTTAGQEVADYDIGDAVPYELTFTLPSNYADYVNYPITFTDDMCAGLTYNNDAKIYYGASDTTGADITFTSGGTSSYSGTLWTSSAVDLKSHTPALSAGDVIKVKYTATLNSNAAVNNVGNPNKYHVTFYSDPNVSTTPGSGDTTTPTPPTNDTPDDTTVVFTYELVFNKVDDQTTPQALTGADFKLEKNVGGTWTDVTALHSGAGAINPTKTGTSSGSTFTFHGLDAGSYKLTEITTPNGYNTIDPIEFTVAATKSDTAVTGLSSTGLTMTPTFDASDAKLVATIQNNKGVTLPSTGGMGTTVFYIVGGLLVAGALVLLIVKKRMNIKEK